MSRTRRASKYCRRWLYAYWVSAALNASAVLLALTANDIPPTAYFAVLAGAVTSIAGACMATHLVRVGVPDLDFDEATETMRVIVIGWLLLCAALMITVVVATDFGARASVEPEVTAAVLKFTEGVTAELFGVASLFVIVGVSYTKYRRLLKEHAASRTRSGGELSER